MSLRYQKLQNASKKEIVQNKVQPGGGDRWREQSDAGWIISILSAAQMLHHNPIIAADILYK